MKSRRRVNSTVMRFPIIYRLLIATVAIHIASSAVFADLAAPAYPYVVASKDGTHYFKMLPDPKNLFAWDTRGTGIAYEVTKNGKDKVLWRVSGWYAFSTFISDDGKYLVRMGNWSPDSPSNKHLAIAFYANGQLLKTYSTVGLLKDPARVRRSISHYQWLKDALGFDAVTESFSLVTIENIEYTFDLPTGNIRYEEPAKSSGELLRLGTLSLCSTQSHNTSLDPSGGSVFLN